MLIVFFVFALAGVVTSSTPWTVHGVPEFKLTGDHILYSYGVYRADVTVGNPSKVYNLHLETGSDITWIRCNTSFSFEQPSLWNVYRPYNSLTGSTLRCGDKLCGTTFPSSKKCHHPDEPCPYSVTYADGRGSSGFYVSDILRLKMKGPEATSYEVLAYLVYGCATEVRGNFYSDGVLALSHEKASIIRQFEPQGRFQGIISHCLSGQLRGGGFLMLGEAVKLSKMSYTPLDLSCNDYRFFYRVEIESIMVDGNNLLIDRNAFTNSHNQGTTIDAGSNLMSLVPEAYYPVIAAISNTVNLSWSNGGYSYLLCCATNIIERSMHKFPTINMNMKGGSTILLLPQTYLVANDSIHTCIGIVKSFDGFNSLGAIVLKDKLIEYDLNNRKLGWGSYNCSLSPNTTLKFPEFPPEESDENFTHRLITAVVITVCITIVHCIGSCCIYHLCRRPRRR